MLEGKQLPWKFCYIEIKGYFSLTLRNSWKINNRFLPRLPFHDLSSFNKTMREISIECENVLETKLKSFDYIRLYPSLKGTERLNLKQVRIKRTNLKVS